MNIHSQTATSPLNEIPGYQIIRQIGKGGMAGVYLAIQNCFDRKVALKVIAAGEDPDFTQRFEREAKIVAQLTHPHIIAVHDVGYSGDYHYIAMDYLPGDSLKDLIHNGLAIDDSLRIIRQIALALDYAHDKGYIHRDVKPDNVLFREDGSAVLCDFGIARDTAHSQRMTQTGRAVGTPLYMSPEQASGEHVDSRADLYALGIVFFEMLTGTVPYDGNDAVAIGIRHISDPLPVLPLELTSLQSLLDRLLEKDPDDRFQYARDFVALLDELDEWQLAEFRQFDLQRRALEAVKDGNNPSGNNPSDNNSSSSEYISQQTGGALESEGDGASFSFASDTGNPFAKSDTVGLLMKLVLLVVIVISAAVIFFPEVLPELSVPDVFKDVLGKTGNAK